MEEDATQIPALLAMSFRAVMDEVREHLAAAGFGDARPAHGFAFQYLASRGGTTAVELADHLGMTKQAAVRLVGDLERRGYVERRPHPHDRRARIVTLAARGRACVDQVVAEWAAIEGQWAERIGAERVEQLRATLHDLVAETSRRRPVTLRPVW